MNKFKDIGTKYWRVFRYLLVRFFESGCTYRAASLTFTTLLSLVPLIAVSFAILSSFPAFKAFGLEIQEFIISNFVANASKVVQSHLQEFVQNVSRLSILSLSILLLTAVLMMYTMEQSFNAIWRIRSRRSFGSALILYWGVLTISPIILGLGLIFGSFVTTLPSVSHTVEDLGIRDFVLPMLSFLLSTSLFTIFYIVIPNCNVRFTHGLIAGIIAGTLFELSKGAFSLYLYFIPTYQLLYGALSAIPIFFVWVYLSWLIILFGVVISHTLAFRTKLQGGVKLDGFSHAVFWLGKFWKAQQAGTALSLEQLVSEDPFDYQVEPEDQLVCLLRAKLIQRTSEGKYVLSRDLTTYTLNDLYHSLPWKLPSVETIKNYPMQRQLHFEERLQQAEQSIVDNLIKTPLSQLFI